MGEVSALARNDVVTRSPHGGIGEPVQDPERWRRYILESLVESAVGMQLANAAAAGDCELFYWRENNHEVDFVVRRRSRVMAIEVKSGQALARHAGLEAFAKAFAPEISLVVGTGGVELERFLSQPVASWFEHGAGT